MFQGRSAEFAPAIPRTPNDESTMEVMWDAFGKLHVYEMTEASLIGVCRINGCVDPDTARAQIERMVNFGYLTQRIGDNGSTILYSRGRMSPKKSGLLYQ
jgi:hypothetical protein